MRVITAIASKDIADALRNRTITTVMLGLAFMMLSSQALPFLLKLRPLPKAAVFDPGRSDLVGRLTEADGYSVRRFPSMEEVEAWISEASEIELGLLIPDDIDQQAADGRKLELEGVAIHWADSSRLTEIVEFFQSRLSEAAGTPVIIRLSQDRVFPKPDAGGRPFMASMSFVVAVVMVGVFMVPYLMIEEKETRTIDTLLISPASYSEVVIGKAIAGSFYCLAAAAVMFVFNGNLVHLWGIAVLSLVCGALFTVSVGLLMGVLFDNPASMNLGLGLLMLILLVPVLLVDTMGSKLPQIVVTLITGIPTVGLSRAFRVSFAESAHLDIMLTSISVVLCAAVLVLCLVVWRVRQLDR